MGLDRFWAASWITSPVSTELLPAKRKRPCKQGLGKIVVERRRIDPTRAKSLIH